MRVKFVTRLREIVGQKEIEIHIERRIKIIDILEILSNKYREMFKNYVFDLKTGNPQSGLIFLLNGLHIRDLKTEVVNNDVLAILPPAAGG